MPERKIRNMYVRPMQEESCQLTKWNHVHKRTYMFPVLKLNPAITHFKGLVKIMLCTKVFIIAYI